MKTIYFTKGFVWVKNGDEMVLRGGSLIECHSAGEAINNAKRISSSSYAGVIAAMQEYDEVSSEYRVCHLLAKYGVVPDLQAI